MAEYTGIILVHRLDQDEFTTAIEKMEGVKLLHSIEKFKPFVEMHIEYTTLTHIFHLGREMERVCNNELF